MLSGLAPDTEYYFEVQATNAGGTTDGTILNFTTSAAVVTAPAVTTDAATSITSTGATLNGTVNPEGGATTYSFVYGRNPTLNSGTTTTTAQSAGSGTNPEAETAAISGLTPDKKYYFELQSTNAAGTTDGTIFNFTTLAVPKPGATTDAATSITSTAATLNASVDPEGSTATYSFVYGTNPTLSSGTTTTTAQSAGSGTNAEAETVAISALTPDTEYYFEVQATNAGGTTDGTVLNFTTSAVPMPGATTDAATSITSTGAMLNASVNPEGSTATYSFVYGTNPTLSSAPRRRLLNRPAAGQTPRQKRWQFLP